MRKRGVGRTLPAAAALGFVLGIAVAVPSGCTTTGRSGTPTEVTTPTDTPEPPPTSTSSVTSTRTSSPSRTPTNSPTFTSTATPFATPAVTGTPMSITVDCWSGGGCNVCGNTQYQCISATSNCTFTDPCPGGQTARQIAAAIFGVPCTAGLGFDTNVNGTAVGSTTGLASNCFCNTCDIWVHMSPYYAGGFPAYVSGGTNTFTITNLTGTLCLSSVDVTIGCQ